MSLAVALYGSANDNEPLQKEVTWEELSSALSTHVLREEKLEGTAWSPALFKPDTRRAGENVVSLSCAVFDLDHVAESDAEASLAKLMSSDTACAVHSTFSHAPPADCCLRVVLPLLRPITPAEWVNLRPTLIMHLGLPAEGRIGTDNKTKDPSRLYFTPARPTGSPEPLAFARSGPFLDPDAFLRPIVAPAPVQSPSEPVKALDMRPLRRLVTTRFNKAHKEGRIQNEWVRAGIPKILGEVALAEHGDRNETLNNCLSWLRYALPDVSLQEIRELVRPSVEALPEGSETTMEKADDMLERANAAFERDQAARLAAERYAKSLQLMAHVDPAAPESVERYTDAEVTEWAREQACELGAFTKRWILNTPLGLFFFASGVYEGPVRSNLEIVSALPQYLARADSGAPWGVTFFVPKADGNGLKSVPRDEIIRAHGTHLRNVEYSFVRQKTELDAATSTLHLPVRPLRPWKPVEHADVHEWLRRIGGEKHAEKVLDWVATVTRLDRMSCALYIESPKSLGKNLLANGLAKLWTEGMPAKFADLVSDFQDSLMHCPLVHADEALPSDRQSSVILRQLVSNPYTYVNQKFGAKVRVQGAVRLLMTANNSSMLRTAENLTEDDLAATASRILHVKTGTAAGEYRQSLGPEPEVAFRWCEGGAIAEHALWLASTRKVHDAGRFLVEGEASEASHAFALNSEPVEAVCEILVKHLLEPAAACRKACDAGFLAGSGELLVGALPFSDKEVWELYAPTHDQLSPTAVGRALAHVSGELFQVRVGAQRVRVRRVRTAYLRTWIEQSGIGTVERFDERLKAPSAVVDEIKARNTLRFPEAAQ